MNLDLSTRTALVTGASSGLGKAIAFELFKAGALVWVCARDEKKLQKLKKEFEASPSPKGTIDVFSVDATDPKSVSTLFNTTLKGCALDILVNNVGNVQKFGGFFDLSNKDWQEAFDTSFMSAVYFCREAYPLLRKSPAGRIINISSLSARQPGTFNPHYSAMKAAMLNLTKHLSNTFARDGITVNVICPSTIKGGGWDHNVRDRAARDNTSVEDAERTIEEEEKKKNPLRKIGLPEDVANAVLYFATERGFLTGQCLNVDGGAMRTMS